MMNNPFEQSQSTLYTIVNYVKAVRKPSISKNSRAKHKKKRRAVSPHPKAETKPSIITNGDEYLSVLQSPVQSALGEYEVRCTSSYFTTKSKRRSQEDEKSQQSENQDLKTMYTMPFESSANDTNHEDVQDATVGDHSQQMGKNPRDGSKEGQQGDITPATTDKKDDWWPTTPKNPFLEDHDIDITNPFFASNDKSTKRKKSTTNNQQTVKNKNPFLDDEVTESVKRHPSADKSKRKSAARQTKNSFLDSKRPTPEELPHMKDKGNTSKVLETNTANQSMQSSVKEMHLSIARSNSLDTTDRWKTPRGSKTHMVEVSRITPEELNNILERLINYQPSIQAAMDAFETGPAQPLWRRTSGGKNNRGTSNVNNVGFHDENVYQDDDDEDPSTTAQLLSYDSLETSSQWSASAFTEPIQWKNFEWLVAPQRKWDQIAQTSDQIVSRADAPVQIRLKDIQESIQDMTSALVAPHQSPVTIATQFSHIAKQFSDRMTLFERNGNGKWVGMSFHDVQQKVEQIAAGFVFSKVTPGSTVIISGTSSSALVLCLLGCAFAGLPAFVLDSFSELHLDVAKHIVQHGKVEAVVCGSHQDSLTVVKHITQFPSIKLVVDTETTQTSSKQISSKARLYPYAQWCLSGNNVTTQVFVSFMNSHLAPNKVAVIRPQYFGAFDHVHRKGKQKTQLYPKYVMYTNDNLVFSSRRIAGKINVKKENEQWFSHLEWSSAIVIDILPALLLGVSLYICPSSRSDEQMFEYCAEVKPTMFLSSTSILRNIAKVLHAREAELERRSKLRYRLHKWARNQASKTGLRLDMGEHQKVGLWAKLKFNLAEFLVFRKIKRQLGLQKAYGSSIFTLNATARNPRMFRLSLGFEDFDEITKHYLRSINLPFLTWFWFNELGTVAIQTARTGRATHHTEALLLDDISCTTAKAIQITDQDELCFAGRLIFAGYLGDEKAAHNNFLPGEKYFRSGVQGAKYKRLVQITRRLDSYLVTKSAMTNFAIMMEITRNVRIEANTICFTPGRTINYQAIEKCFKANIPSNVIKDCVVIGEGNENLTILLSFYTTNESSKGAFMLNLSTVNWCSKLGSTASCIEEILDYKDKLVRNEIIRIIAQTNNQLHSHKDRITSFVILPRNLQEGTEIEETTGIIKRHIVQKVFQKQINKAMKKQWRMLSS